MSEPASKERLLAAAKTLVLAHGYSGTTVDAICEKAGLTKGSFYHFFKSKEELGLATLEWSMRKGGEILGSGPHAGIADPVEQAFVFLEHVECCAEELWANGCLLGSFALELADTHPRMQATVSRMFAEVAELFADRFAPIVRSSAGDGLPSARELAEEYLALLEGSIILAKAHRDPSRIATALRAFRKNLSRLASQSV